MSIHSTLESHIEALHTLYERNFQVVRTLQKTLLEEILPALEDELQMDAEKVVAATQWLEDTPSIFRTLKRHKFTTSFALEALRSTLCWRAKDLPRLDFAAPSSFLQCLPPNVQDPFGRPILVVRLSGITESPNDMRQALLRNVELIRLHLQQLNRDREAEHRGFRPILQCIALLDIKGVSLSSVQKIDLLAWYMNDLLPRFPGLLAAVFVLNYSWAHNGLWNLAKRALPSTALAKVFFPTQTELLEYFSPSVIPRDYGGQLPFLSQLDDPLHAFVRSASAAAHRALSIQRSPPPDLPATPSNPQPVGVVSRPPMTIAPTSSLNPFFGYPVYYGASSTVPTLHHGRRRKRDLVRTLAHLWWVRWRKHVTRSIYVLLALMVVLAVRKAPWREWRRQWKGFVFRALGVYLASTSVTSARTPIGFNIS